MYARYASFLQFRFQKFISFIAPKKPQRGPLLLQAKKIWYSAGFEPAQTDFQLLSHPL